MGAKVALTVALCLKNVGANNSFSSSSILVNLLAPASQVGAINGASQTLASFVRAVRPSPSRICRTSPTRSLACYCALAWLRWG